MCILVGSPCGFGWIGDRLLLTVYESVLLCVVGVKNKEKMNDWLQSLVGLCLDSPTVNKRNSK